MNGANLFDLVALATQADGAKDGVTKRLLFRLLDGGTVVVIVGGELMSLRKLIDLNLVGVRTLRSLLLLKVTTLKVGAWRLEKHQIFIVAAVKVIGRELWHGRVDLGASRDADSIEKGVTLEAVILELLFLCRLLDLANGLGHAVLAVRDPLLVVGGGLDEDV